MDQAHVDDILAAVEQAFDIGRHGRVARLLQIPHRLHWLLWLLANLDRRSPLKRDDPSGPARCAASVPWL
jgi:hypothetical protein